MSADEIQRPAPGAIPVNQPVAGHDPRVSRPYKKIAASNYQVSKYKQAKKDSDQGQTSQIDIEWVL